MKSKTFYIAVAAAAFAALGIYYYSVRRRESQPWTIEKGNRDYVGIADFGSLNYNQTLDADTKPGSGEVVALQRMLSQFGYSLDVTGTFDRATEAAVRDLTGKRQTNLAEMRYQYYGPRFGDAAAVELFKTVLRK